MNQIIQPIKPANPGGGVLGSVVGAIAGLGLGALTAGAAAPAGAAIGQAVAGGALTGAGVGQTVGGIAGNALDPAHGQSQTKEVGETPVQRTPLTVSMNMPEVQMASMQNAKNLLSTSSVPGASNYMDMLDQAQNKMKAQLGSNSSMGGIYGS